MTVVATKRRSRRNALLRAQRLSHEITGKTVASGLTNKQIGKDVRKVFQDVKANRLSGEN